jgi:hypothetical protein
LAEYECHHRGLSDDGDVTERDEKSTMLKKYFAEMMEAL